MYKIELDGNELGRVRTKEEASDIATEYNNRGIGNGEVSYEYYPSITVHFPTGLVWTKELILEGTPNDDLIEMIDDYVSTFGIDSIPVKLWKSSEIRKEEQQYYLPINGGQYWIYSQDLMITKNEE